MLSRHFWQGEKAMNCDERKAILALLVCLAATVTVLFLLSPPNTQAATLTVDSTAASGLSTLRGYEWITVTTPSISAQPAATWGNQVAGDDATSHTFSINVAESNTLTCPGKTTLEDLVTCIVGQMPGKGSEGFEKPTDIQSAWGDVIRQMLDGRCDDITLPSGLSGVYSVSTRLYEGKNYCVLMEILDQDNNGIVDRGWGTFIVNPYPCRELSIQIAHPIHDIGTATQGIGVFKGTNSRSFLMAGTHRHANFVCSACQHPDCEPEEVVTEPKKFLEADVAHNVENMFQPTVEELLEFYNDTGANFVTIQFHGMSTSSCDGVDVYMTCGLSTPPAPDDKILELKSNLVKHNPNWRVGVPGDGTSCNLYGSTNVQGQLLNNVAVTDVCTTEASSYSGKFIHIEQKPGPDDEKKPGPFRNADNWIEAVNDTWSLLTVTKHASPSPVQDGKQLTYTLRVTNTSAVTLTATITDILPTHVTPTGVFTWTQTITAPGGVWMQQIVVTVETGYEGPLTNMVEVTTGEGATGKASLTVCANVCKIYLPVVLKNPINITGIICRVAVEDVDPYKIWLHRRHINAHFMGLTPPFNAKVRPIDPVTGAEWGNWVSLPVDSFDNSIGMRPWEVCDIAMKKAIRQVLCAEDPECDLDEIVYIEPPEQRPPRTLRFVIEGE
jgi:uncharacterized repeat protein (TIGR01451 family)